MVTGYASRCELLCLQTRSMLSDDAAMVTGYASRCEQLLHPETSRLAGPSQW